MENEPMHLIADGEAVTSCCGRTPFELPRTDRLTVDPALAGGCVVDIAAWLTAIWDEDEQLANDAYRAGFDFHTPTGEHWGVPHVIGQHMLRHEPTAVLARIAADRQILAECSIVLEDQSPERVRERVRERVLAWAVVRQLASVHRDRPDWREAWQ